MHLKREGGIVDGWYRCDLLLTINDSKYTMQRIYPSEELNGTSYYDVTGAGNYLHPRRSIRARLGSY